MSGEAAQPAASKPRGKEDKFHAYPFYSPRFWHGMRLRTWMRILFRNRLRVTPSRWGLACTVTLLAVWNSLLHRLHAMLFGRTIAATKLVEDPIFIIGHWRSGTTYLHELFELDKRFTTPNSFECFMPHHVMLSAWFMMRYMKFLIPSQRPMDNVAAGWDRPQEDEFALCNLGLGSPYETMAFPNEPPQGQEFLEMENVPPDERQRWKEGVIWFLKLITYRRPKQIVLKSPTHTARIKILLEMFPNAKFIHIARDPRVVFHSTVRLWKSLYPVQGLQHPKFEGLEEFVFQSFERMYRQYDAQKPLIPPGRLYEVRYEDLVRDPVGQMRAIYERLQLHDFEDIRPGLEKVAAASKGYRTNRYEIDPEIQRQIESRWGNYLRNFDYELTRSDGASSDSSGAPVVAPS